MTWAAQKYKGPKYPLVVEKVHYHENILGSNFRTREHFDEKVKKYHRHA